MATSDELKAKGNAAFSAGQFEDAVKHFSDAIAVDPSNHVLYSNRSASHASLGKFEDALTDAQKVVDLKPDWPKGYSRLGAALHGLHRWDDAVAAYEDGLKLDPSNEQMKQGMQEAKAAGSKTPPGGGFFGLFSAPEIMSRLAMDPRTRPFLAQPDFMAMLQEVNTDPGAMQKYWNDDRFKAALEVGLGMGMGPGPGAPGAGGDASDTANTAGDSKPAKEPEPAPEPEPEPEPMDEEAAAAAAAKKAAQQEKEAGNAAYKAKDFATAIVHYNKAIELDDTDISFLTNRAAVKFEQADYEGCVADCDAAVERGRELRADYKLVARAMTRKGNAMAKMGDLEGAVAVYNRSLTEHRNPDTLKRLQETEKALKEKTENDYINPDIAAEEKEKGNAAFKEQKYPEAVQHYSEALKRGPAKVNPEAYKLFSNRAACYTKLGAWNEGLRDAEQCIALAPTFAKGYSRKGHLQFFMKEYNKAMATYEEGLTHDPDNAELKEGLMRCIGAINKMNRGEMTEEELKQRQERGMADPEVQSILTDPVMRNVLRDMQEDPATAQKHLSHPDIAAKVQKLVAAGIIQIQR